MPTSKTRPDERVFHSNAGLIIYLRTSFRAEVRTLERTMQRTEERAYERTYGKKRDLTALFEFA